MAASNAIPAQSASGIIPGLNTAIGAYGAIMGAAKLISSIGSHSGHSYTHHENTLQVPLVAPTHGETEPGTTGDPWLDAIQLAVIQDNQYHKDWPIAYGGCRYENFIGWDAYTRKSAAGTTTAAEDACVNTYLGATYVRYAVPSFVSAPPPAGAIANDILSPNGGTRGAITIPPQTTMPVNAQTNRGGTLTASAVPATNSTALVVMGIGVVIALVLLKG